MPPSHDEPDASPERRGVRILLVCPDPLRADALRRELEERFLNGRVHHAPGFPEARASLRDVPFEIVAVDGVLLPTEGLRFLVEVQPLAPGAVRVLLTPPPEGAPREAGARPAPPGVHYLWVPPA